MASHTISVTVEKASIQVNPETLRMTMADDVQWAGTTSKAFTLVFDNEGIFGRRDLDHATARSRQRAQAKGRFKYTVVSAEDSSLRLDPIIIVGDPPTGTEG